MLREANALSSFTLGAVDGEIGNVQDLYFDDRHWTVRYLVANTGSWLLQRFVLVSPYALLSVEPDRKLIATTLTKKQIEESPRADSERPISRQYEISYHEYYAWPPYWTGPFEWGPASNPSRPPLFDWTVHEESGWDGHLRSSSEVSGYTVEATDGGIGHVADFIIDDETWVIRYLVVDTRNWWPGKHVLVSPRWTKRVTWTERKVYVDLSRDTLKNSPEYVHGAEITREYERQLCRHYGRQGYWPDEACS